MSIQFVLFNILVWTVIDLIMIYTINIREMMEEADTEARKVSKGMVPNDANFWMRVNNHFNHVVAENDDLANRVPQPMLMYDSARVYPKTNHPVRCHGISGPFVNITDVLSTIPNNHSHVMNAFSSCMNYYEVRHDAFINLLSGQAKDVYRSVVNDYTRDTWLSGLTGYQKTNYVCHQIISTIYTPEVVDTLRTQFYNLRQLPRQTGVEYCGFVEAKRSILVSMGEPITDDHVRAKLLTTLNPTYSGLIMNWDREGKTKTDVENKLRRLDVIVGKESMGKRKREDSTPTRTAFATHSDPTTLRRDGRRKVQCHHCRKYGHIRPECEIWKRERAASTYASANSTSNNGNVKDNRASGNGNNRVNDRTRRVMMVSKRHLNEDEVDLNDDESDASDATLLA